MFVWNGVMHPSAAGGPVGIPVEAIDPLVGWFVYLTALSATCAVLWVVNRLPASGKPAPEPDDRVLDEAA